MMNDEKRIILILASRILTYPVEEFASYEEWMDELVNEEVESEELKLKIRLSYKRIFRISLHDLREIYVSTFDLKSKLGLYLTAHELGDSTKRGAALIRMQNLISQTGFEREGDELADYMPMLFELIAAAEETEECERLYRRLGVAVQRMVGHIEAANPYSGILHILMDVVFPNPTKEEIARLEFDREEADLEELPYPIMYQ